jgi:hypothetical protein
VTKKIKCFATFSSDGSSNPELNCLPEKHPQRSPGNGRSASEDNVDGFVDDSINAIDDDEEEEKANVDVGSKSKRFSFRFLKIFSSTRSKSNNHKNDQVSI